jgi:hypothetical protein
MVTASNAAGVDPDLDFYHLLVAVFFKYHTTPPALGVFIRLHEIELGAFHNFILTLKNGSSGPGQRQLAMSKDINRKWLIPRCEA